MGESGYCNSEVLVILYVVFMWQLNYTLIPFSSSILSPTNNMILKDVAVMKSDILKQ